MEKEQKTVKKSPWGLPQIAVAAVLVLVVGFVAFKLFLPQGVGGDAAGPGDRVSFDFIEYYDNGSVFDTSMESIAIDNLVWVQGKPYHPLTVTLGASSGNLIKGLDEAFAGVKKGDVKQVSIPPEKAYGSRDPSLVANIQSEYEVPRVQNVSRAYFQSKWGEPVVGGSAAIGFWNATVLSVSNDTVSVRNDPDLKQGFQMDKLYLLLKDEKYFLQHVPANITYVSNDTFAFAPQLESGKVYTALDANTSEPRLVTLVYEDDVNAVFDFNHPLAGQNISFQLYIRDVVKNK